MKNNSFEISKVKLTQKLDFLSGYGDAGGGWGWGDDWKMKL